MNAPAASSRTIGLLVLTAVILLAIALPRFTLTYDLGFFLPPPETDAQRLLIERLGQGPGTQLIFAVLPDATEAAAIATAIKLREQTGIERVLPEALVPGIEAIPAAVWQNRLLLGDLPQSVDAWQEILEERLMDTMVADDQLIDLIAADPALESIRALERASSATLEPVFKSEDARYLLIQTVGAAFDLDAQQAIVPAIRKTLSEEGHGDATLYGSGVYGVDLQSSISQESILFSLLASLALASVVYFRFRNPRTVLAVGVPLFVGAAAGIAALAFLFEKVHGITLAFGFTLLGVAIDYPLHVFSHASYNQPQQRSIWPTLGLGIASTVIAYLAFVVSGTAGMQQLGVFASVGIVVAALSAFLLSPDPAVSMSVTDAQAGDSHSGEKRPALTKTVSKKIASKKIKARQWLWLLAVAGVALALHNKTLFADNLSEMTPVPKETLAADARLRKMMGVADIRYLISVRHDNLQATLEGLEEVETLLEKAAGAGWLEGFQSAAAILPSEERQRNRRQLAQALLNSKNFELAIADSDFELEAFTPFIEELQLTAEERHSGDSRDSRDSRDSAFSEHAFLNREKLIQQSPELKPLLDALLYRVGNSDAAPDQSDDWVGLVFLSGLSTEISATETDQFFKKMLAAVPESEFVDLKQASMSLVSTYRESVFKLLGVALIAIAVLLLIATRNPLRVVWLLGTIAAALGVSLVAGTYLLGGLSLFDVIALALVAGLGLDYALFFSRGDDTPDTARSTNRAVALCALSSLLVFGILAFSSVPLLRSLGITVASGVAAAYLLSRFGRYS